MPPLEREGFEGYINLGLEPVLEIITYEKEDRESVTKSSVKASYHLEKT